MVSHKTRQRKTVKIVVAFIVAFFLTLVFAICLVKFIDDNKHKNENSTLDNYEEKVEPEEEYDDDEQSAQIVKIDFQPVIDKWSSSISGSKGIVIYDLDTDEIVGGYNMDKKFATASLYKLFVVYEGYRRLENKTWDANSMVGRTGKTISQCLYLAIRESNSSCAETLWAMIGHNSLDDILDKDFGFNDFSVGNLSATPFEIMQMMRIFYEHADIKDETLISTMQDSFLHQPITAYNWRQGLPSGFSEAVKVYNKVGWNYDSDIRAWTIYDDAAILDFTSYDRHFVIVVMTSKVSPADIGKLGSQIESMVINTY